jgi:predicted nucleic acid-binding Zn ribbon protein
MSREQDFRRVACCSSRSCLVCAGTGRRVVRLTRKRGKKRECPVCRKGFRTAPGGKRFCSSACAAIDLGKRKAAGRHCSQCRLPLSKDTRFCGRSCARTYVRARARDAKGGAS